jgi:hypothetical protein
MPDEQTKLVLEQWTLIRRKLGDIRTVTMGVVDGMQRLEPG